MANKENSSDNTLEQIGGFFEALFGACMGEDRKANKNKKDGDRRNVLPQANQDFIKSKSDKNILENLLQAFNPDKEELTELKQDVNQVKEMLKYREKGLGSRIEKASEYVTGQRPPGFFTDFTDMVTGKTPKYAIPLHQDLRDITVENLREYSQQNSPNDIYGLSGKASSIADNLEKKDADDVYIYQSLAGAADASGLTKDKFQNLYGILSKSKEIAQERAQYSRSSPNSTGHLLPKSQRPEFGLSSSVGGGSRNRLWTSRVSRGIRLNGMSTNRSSRT